MDDWPIDEAMMDGSDGRHRSIYLQKWDFIICVMLT